MSRQKRLFMAFHSFDYKHGAPLARERQGLKSLVGGHDAVEALRRGGIRIGELHLDVGCHYCAGNIYPDGVVEAVRHRDGSPGSRDSGDAANRTNP